MFAVAVLVLSTALAINAQVDVHEKLKAMRDLPEVQQCIESTGFTPDESKRKEMTPEALCFFKCFMEKRGLLNENGEIDPESVEQAPFSIPEDKKQEMKECLRSAGKIETCEDVKNVLKCNRN